MTDSITTEFTGNEIESVNTQHVACLLLLDNSGSMGQRQGNTLPIDELNKGIKLFKEQAMKDENARDIIDVAIVSFNDEPHIVQNFVPLSRMEVPVLTAGGTTAMGQGVEKAIELCEKRKTLYKNLGVTYKQPMIFLLTDGYPTDKWNAASEKAQNWQTGKHGTIFGIGSPGYDQKILRQFAPTHLIEMKNIDFPSIFVWISASIIGIGTSSPDTKSDPLPNLTGQNQFVPPVSS